MKTGLFAAASAAFCLLASAAAAATVVETTYTGRFTGQDWTGYFGTPQANLTDVAFTAVFTTDLSKGTRVTVPGSFDIVNGWDANSPATATFTMNGITLDFEGATFGKAHVKSEEFAINSVDRSDDSESGVVTEFLLALGISTHLAPALLTTPWATDVGAQMDGSFMSFYQVDLDQNEDIISVWGTPHVHDISTRVYDIPGPGAIPEPGTWALMITGFGLAGVAIRRRRATLAYA